VGLRILTAMKRVAYREDGSRPVTVAPPPLGMGLGQGGLNVSDVMGYNYADPQIEAYHKEHPKNPVIGTENVSAVATRGCYKIDPAKGAVSSYDPYTTTGRASAEGWWRFCNSRPWVSGGFVWTGFDYRGEPSPYQWPNISSQYGVIDTCGFPKDTFYYYRAWWTTQPVLHIFPHWNWEGLEGKEIAVWVYANMEQVELFQDGKSLGKKDMPKDSHLQWIVTYRPGVLEARGYRNGQVVLAAERKTVGRAARLAVRPERSEIHADGEDVTFVRVEVLDAEDNVLPITEQEIAFEVSGPGRLIGVGNGDPTSHESDIGSTRRAFGGLCMGIVQAGKTEGDIKVKVTSAGLTPGIGTVFAKGVIPRPQVAAWEREVPSGEGVTGLWRPTAPAATGGFDPLQLAVAGDTIYTLRQSGGVLTGTLEAPPSAFGPAASGAIEDGRVDGNNISFRVGTTSYSGTVNGDRMELRRMAPPRGGVAPARPADTGPQPVIGPPPEGSDPSLGVGNRGGGAQPSFVLRRANR
jgi:beta-galactosidase